MKIALFRPFSHFFVIFVSFDSSPVVSCMGPHSAVIPTVTPLLGPHSAVIPTVTPLWDHQWHGFSTVGPPMARILHCGNTVAVSEATVAVSEATVAVSEATVRLQWEYSGNSGARDHPDPYHGATTHPRRWWHHPIPGYPHHHGRYTHPSCPPRQHVATVRQASFGLHSLHGYRDSGYFHCSG